VSQVISASENGYTYAEAQALIEKYADRLRGQKVTTNKTPQLTTVSGVVEEFIALPYLPAFKSFDLALLNYQMALHKADWLANQRRKGGRWLPLVRIGADYIAMVPVLFERGLWQE
jgi:hypothetical protein